MDRLGFIEYSSLVSPSGSRKAACYATAIQILDEIFEQHDAMNLQGASLYSVDDAELLMRIKDFVVEEQKKAKHGNASIFDYGKPNQRSYATNRFCSSALQGLIGYLQYERNVVAANEIVSKEKSAKKISAKLLTHFDLTKEGKDAATESKRRVGQEYFRRMILTNYDCHCCVTGLNVPVVLRASHIVEWSKDKANRLNPENGLCLSATYDAAFDKHLISFDEDYRMIVSPIIREFYTAQATRDYFEAFEGKRITLPNHFKPSQNLLAKHREMLVL